MKKITFIKNQSTDLTIFFINLVQLRHFEYLDITRQISCTQKK